MSKRVREQKATASHYAGQRAYREVVYLAPVPLSVFSSIQQAIGIFGQQEQKQLAMVGFLHGFAGRI